MSNYLLEQKSVQQMDQSRREQTFVKIAALAQCIKAAMYYTPVERADTHKYIELMICKWASDPRRAHLGRTGAPAIELVADGLEQ